jgi:hypothetical protein
MNTENSRKDTGNAQVGGKNSGTGFINVMKSAMAAAFGVQSQANRERDFTEGKPIHFIVAGIVATLIFLVCVGLFVKVMLATAP